MPVISVLMTTVDEGPDPTALTLQASPLLVSPRTGPLLLSMPTFQMSKGRHREPG